MTTTVAFVCVQNAGRSQMAAAFAECERDERGLADIEILTGGTHPADAVHSEVVDAMQELGFDLAERTPQAISEETLAGCEYVATMGCSTLSLPERVETRDWALDDPHGASDERVREIRDEIAARVAALFNDVEAAREA
jgi:protein-tyrosine-phosphatase